MRTGLLTFVAVAGFLLFAPMLLALLVWPLGGGALLNSLFGVATLVVIVLGAWTARGTYNFRYHVKDMLPGAITFFVVVWLIQRLTS